MKIPYISILLIFMCIVAYPQLKYSDLSNEQKAFYDEHVFGGQPDDNEILVRTAYVTSYNSQYRIPNWSAYHITSDYLKTPERDGKFKKFRPDPDVQDPVKDDEYNGLFSLYNYARGHLAPYNIFGGDRDSDGVYAKLNGNSDDYDENTVFEGNYLSNIAPQLHYGFNGSGGLWYKAERWIQDDLVEENGNEVWVYSGCLVHDSRTMETVGSNNSIVVPDQFYKVVIIKDGVNFPKVLVFLFPHFDHKDDLKEKNIFKFLVTVDYLEAISNLDFFSNYSSTLQKENEGKTDFTFWKQFIDN